MEVLNDWTSESVHEYGASEGMLGLLSMSAPQNSYLGFCI